MATRSIWKGTVGFGLVSVPCKLYGAIEDKKAKFVQLCSCGQRIKMPKTCPEHGPLMPDQIRKGYALGKDEYLKIEDSDFASLPVKSLKSVDIIGFVDLMPDIRMFDTPYYLGVEKGGEKAYGLLLRAMQEEGVVGIAKLTMREREHLCAILPENGILQLFTLRWADEIRPFDEIKPKPVTISDKELAMGRKLVESMRTKFEPEKYEDEYRLAVEKLIGDLLIGVKPAVQAVAEPVATSDDKLLEQLMASVGGAA